MGESCLHNRDDQCFRGCPECPRYRPTQECECCGDLVRITDEKDLYRDEFDTNLCDDCYEDYLVIGVCEDYYEEYLEE